MKEAEALGVSDSGCVRQWYEVGRCPPSREMRMVLNQALKDAGEQPLEVPKAETSGQ